MYRHLLTAGLLLAGVFTTAMAVTKTYTSDNLGEVGNVADNGKYVAIFDVEDLRAYVWNSEDGAFVDITLSNEESNLPPAQKITGTSATDVSNDGIVVGSIYYASGQQTPAYYKDGEWHLLELHPGAMNTNEAIAITPDGKIIGGYQFINDPESEIGGRYYPVQWIMEGDQYVLHAYTDSEMPDHQGFYPYTQTADGRAIGGVLYCGVNSTVPALFIDGKLKTFDTFETKLEPWQYKGKWYCGLDENKKQIWTTDPDDPRIELFEEYYINGFHDNGTESLLGGFMNCDAAGFFYGMRTRVENVDEDGNGNLIGGAAIYNYLTDTWIYNKAYQGFAGGLNGNYVLTSGTTVIIDEKPEAIIDRFGIESSRSIAYLKSYSDDGKVIGGMTYEINPASGEYQYFPLILVLDEPLTAGIDAITDGKDGNSPVISISGDRVEVIGAKAVAIYDLSGKKVSGSAVSHLHPGMYVVKADGATRKIFVK